VQEIMLEMTVTHFDPRLVEQFLPLAKELVTNER
jgi:response regulator RpfG family c-di-GMP phosphodiesterase